MTIGCLTTRSALRFRAIDRNASVCRLLTDDDGQDVVEYALLGAIVGVASILTWQLLATTVGDVYSAADADVQGASACTPDPGGGGCP